MNKLLYAIIALLISTNQVIAADATGTASATIVAPIAISAGAAMNFGTMAPTGTAGTVLVNTSGGTTATNVTELGSGSSSQGVFTVTGEGSATYSLTVPTTDVTLTSGSDTMVVNAFNHDAGATPAIASGGTSTINVGATLNVGSAQAVGSYTGTYTVTVNYN